MNMMVVVLSCLGLLLAAAAAQYVKPCVSPPLLSGSFGVAADGMTASGEITYDAFGQKMRIRTIGLNGTELFSLDHLMIFSKEVMYEIDYWTKTCRKRPLDSSFMPMQVPPDAKLLNQVVLGSSSSTGMGVLVNNWHGYFPGNGTYAATFGEIGCIPMTYSSFFPETGYTFVSTFNWVLGILYPSDLQPPAFCAKSVLEEVEKPETFFTVMASLVKKTSNRD